MTSATNGREHKRIRFGGKWEGHEFHLGQIEFLDWEVIHVKTYNKKLYPNLFFSCFIHFWVKHAQKYELDTFINTQNWIYVLESTDWVYVPLYLKGKELVQKLKLKIQSKVIISGSACK